MARQRITEFRAKTLLFARLDRPYFGIQVFSDRDIEPQLKSLSPEQKYVVKVDQGVKKRMKRGLIGLNLNPQEIPAVLSDITAKGFSQFLIEPMARYDGEHEKYFAMERQRDGYVVSISPRGGIDIEEYEDTVQQVLLPYQQEQRTEGKAQIAASIGLSPDIIETFIAVFDEHYFSFLEINPLVLQGNELHVIDLAVEVDSVADFFAGKSWGAHDFTYGEHGAQTAEEGVVQELKENSQAAFTLTVLNPNGSIFMLLSGGGASLVLADEVANMGLGEELANYGEYSGNPNEEETYIYTTQVLKLLLRSKAEKKVLIIGGGVANFTDIKATFRGVIRALTDYTHELREQQVRVYVRRGGPNQAEGLKQMSEFLTQEALLGRVVGPDVLLTEIVHNATGQV